MDDPLEKLIRELRAESCPSSVMDRVRERIARESRRRTPNRLRFLRPLAVGFALLLVVGSWIARKAPPRPVPPTAELAGTALDRREVLDQTRSALAVVGWVLIDAGAHAEAAVRAQAGPPLVESFRSAKDKISRNL